MSTDSQLPVAAPGGADTAQPSAVVEIDAAAGGGALVGHRGETLVLAAPAPTSSSGQDFAEVPADVARLTADTAADLVRAGGVSADQLEWAQPVFARYAPLFNAALRTCNRREMARLAQHLKWELVAAGALTDRQVESLLPVLAQTRSSFERSLPFFAAPAPASSADIEEMRGLNLMIADPYSAYWKGDRAEKLQARWRELYARGVRGDAKRPTVPSEFEGRISAIQRLMRDTSSEYWKGPNAELLQAEYRELVEQRAFELEQREQRRA